MEAHPWFAEPIATIEAGRVDVVIVRDIDRLTRNLAASNHTSSRSCRLGVEVLSEAV